MKTIINIAKTELQKLFYSPVAWLILIIFFFQAALVFTKSYEGMVQAMAYGLKWPGMTNTIYTSQLGSLFGSIPTYLYLYIPLLTMNLMSREISSGSIKLLYSSPVTNTQIILGKYLSIVLFGGIMVLTTGAFAVYGIVTINHVDILLILCAMLGTFLLICAYGAIGLFMSSITSYTVVAAMGTLGIFSLLAYVRTIGQDIEIVRDITYWFAITGRVNTFISGMLTTEDIFYFLLVIALFLGLTIIKLQSGRQKTSTVIKWGKYFAMIFMVMLLGFISSRPTLKKYADLSATKTNTLTKSSQDVISKLSGGLMITTYVNMYDNNSFRFPPIVIKSDMERYEQYVRFKPEIKLKYKYYFQHIPGSFLEGQFPKLSTQKRLDTLKKINKWKFDILPYSEISKEVDLKSEGFRVVTLLERENGKRAFLRLFDDNSVLPSEAETTAAFKRLTTNIPLVGFVKGHGERESSNNTDRGFSMIAQDKTFRFSLLNQGFDFMDVNLSKPVTSKVNILVIAELNKTMSDGEEANLNDFISRGGNLVILGGAGHQEFMNPIVSKLGVQFLPGRLVKPTEKVSQDLLTLNPTKEAEQFSFHLREMSRQKAPLTMPATSALAFTEDKGYKVTTLFKSDAKGGWNEVETTNFSTETAHMNVAAGELEKAYPTVLALSRRIGNKEQKIVIAGNADFIANGELSTNRKNVGSGNFFFINAIFYWLSDEMVPIDMRRKPLPDDSLNVGESAWDIAAIIFKWVLPILLIIVAIVIWVRRKGR
ncbi:ABC transporter [Pedobacter hiemivivus]|uniref:ABC transporter n=1 Tax=Pedobacter hiemivivus TaxID=2530454 RepID=A0A4U1GUJ7_9SPHI|nr:Gldg family protein [Pedobacter hiemivivus]TKC65662.1 ABC transporter [Pedobacter hiemivivus]